MRKLAERLLADELTVATGNGVLILLPVLTIYTKNAVAATGAAKDA